MNTKLVLGLPRAKQVGLEHTKKKLKRCERWIQRFFLEPFPQSQPIQHDAQVQSDVSAVISLLSHVWMAPVILGAIAVALFGHLSYLMVVLVLEASRFGCIITMGAFNASYIVQFITIFDHSWINNFEDRQVILSSLLCSLLHYSFYVPDLIMVGYSCS